MKAEIDAEPYTTTDQYFSRLPLVKCILMELLYHFIFVIKVNYIEKKLSGKKERSQGLNILAASS